MEDTFAELICTRLTEWRLGSDLTPIRSTDPEIRRLFDLQDSIGWKAFLEGVLDVEWRKFQQTQYDETGSRKTGKRWVVALIRKLWNTAWDMWQHRNEVQNHTVLGALADTVQRQVKEQFRIGPTGLTRQARLMFRGGIQSVLLYRSLPAQQAWLRRVTTARERYAQQQKEGQQEMERMRTSMATFLGRTSRRGTRFRRGPVRSGRGDGRAQHVRPNSRQASLTTDLQL